MDIKLFSDVALFLALLVSTVTISHCAGFVKHNNIQPIKIHLDAIEMLNIVLTLTIAAKIGIQVWNWSNP
ncbi:hypothetical protein PA10_00038 [Pseudomonas phage pPa_SNUABM_DT01]|nr:hypothetical protein PA10_00038 [Pseudomonas phage pPa_SNUABM_DT01]